MRGITSSGRILVGTLLAASVAVAPTGEAYAGATARGDFNDDGFSDLAIGVPSEDVGGDENAGRVHIIYGTADGPDSSDSQVWDQDSSGIADATESKDRFGAALAVGDFDDDGFDDLAIGAPGETVSGTFRSGAVHVLYGSPSGLTSAGAGFLPIGPTAEEVDGGVALSGGSVLAAGDFDGDGFDDLAIGTPNGAAKDKIAAGRLQLFYGTAGGLIFVGLGSLTQDSPGIQGGANPNDRFASALVAGDFDGDGFDDLAFGVPGERVGGSNRAGAVNVLYGGPDGIDPGGDQLWNQNNIDLAGGPERNDEFGRALAAGDFDGDGFDDLAIGAPLEDVETGPAPEIADAGTVLVLYGSAGKLTSTGAQEWTQDVGGISNGTDSGDQFGAALAAGDFIDDSREDLAIGAPFEKEAGISAGAAHVIYGTSSGLNAAGDQFFTQETPGVLDDAGAGDKFGAALAALDLNGDGRIDLAIGVPGETVAGPGTVNAGAVAVLFGSGGGVTTTDNQLWTQNSPGISDSAEAGDGFGGAVGD